MRFTYFLSPLLLLNLSCGSDKTTHTDLEKITQRDLEGKTFDVKRYAKTEATDKTLERVMAMAKVNYQFKADNQMIYHIAIGSMTNVLVFKWTLIADSLLVESSGKEQTKKSIRYLIQRATNGFSLDNHEAHLDLKAR